MSAVDELGVPDICLCGHSFDAHKDHGACSCRRCRCPEWQRDYDAVDHHYRHMRAAS